MLTESFDGVPGGMNLALPAQELDDTEARYLQDVLIDYPGLTRRRGPIRKVVGSPTFSRKGTGIVMTLNPLGVDKYAVLNGDNSNGYMSVLTDDLTAVASDLAWPHPLPTSSPSTPYRIVDAKPALNGGVMVGVSSAYDANSPNQGIAYWMGANKADWTSTITATRGSTAVTGSGFNANVAPGHWVFATTDDGYTSVLLGYVKQVTSDTTLVLGQAAPYNVTAKTATFQALRGLAPKVVTGRITVDTTSTTVTGGATKFISQGLSDAISRSGSTTNGSTTITGLAKTSDLLVGMPVNGTGIPAGAYVASIVSGTSITISAAATATGTPTLSFGSIWNLYRASDMTWVGKVQSVQSEFALTLAANAALAMAGDAYVALRADSDYNIANTTSAKKVGFLNATYAGRQWFANNGGDQTTLVRLWFSDESDPEALDLSSFDGDWDDIANTSGVSESIRALLASQVGLLVFKENETWIVTGSSPNTFSPKKLEDDGTLAGMSVQPWASGAVWAGREGIHYFDGINTQNLTQTKLGDYWKKTVATFDPSKYRMWSMVQRDHYFLHIENVSPSVAVVKGNVSTTPTRLTVVINMITRAVTMHTNLNIRGAVTLPASSGKSVWYLVNGQSSGDVSDHAFICDGDAIFNEEGVDPVTCDGGTAGPDFFFESKKFDAGDPVRLKKFKLMILEYLVQGGYIKVDVALGLNNIAKTLTGNFPQSVLTWDQLRTSVSNWDSLKSQFPTWNDIIQGVFIPKRVKFQKGSQFLSFRLYQSSSSITRLQTGPFGIGYKMKRRGRI